MTNVTGTPEHAGCPCFGDQPLIGADQYGFYVSTNEFPLFQAGFNGAQVYAMSKAKLAAGIDPARGELQRAAARRRPGLHAAARHHRTRRRARDGQQRHRVLPERARFQRHARQPHRRLGAHQHANARQRRPSLTLRSAVLDSQVYGQPPDVKQKPGPTPLADAIKSGAFGKAGAQPLPLIAANDDRMQQVTWADGMLWSSLNTVVKPANGPVQSGAAYFAVAPSWSGGALGGNIVKQGYVSVSGLGIVYPSVGVNKLGKGVMSFSIAGTSMFPSVGYVPIDATQRRWRDHAGGAGRGPRRRLQRLSVLLRRPRRSLGRLLRGGGGCRRHHLVRQRVHPERAAHVAGELGHVHRQGGAVGVPAAGHRMVPAAIRRFSRSFRGLVIAPQDTVVPPCFDDALC